MQEEQGKALQVSVAVGLCVLTQSSEVHERSGHGTLRYNLGI